VLPGYVHRLHSAVLLAYGQFYDGNVGIFSVEQTEVRHMTNKEFEDMARSAVSTAIRLTKVLISMNLAFEEHERDIKNFINNIDPVKHEVLRRDLNRIYSEHVESISDQKKNAAHKATQDRIYEKSVIANGRRLEINPGENFYG